MRIPGRRPQARRDAEASVALVGSLRITFPKVDRSVLARVLDEVDKLDTEAVAPVAAAVAQYAPEVKALLTADCAEDFLVPPDTSVVVESVSRRKNWPAPYASAAVRRRGH